MIILMALIFPILRSLNLISLYAYLEKRFDAATRTIISILFLLTDYKKSTGKYN